MASAFLAAAILLLDLSLPLGVAGGVPYVAVVLLGWWLKQARYIIFLALVCTVLTATGYFFSEKAGIPWMVISNRSLALFAIWVTALLLSLAKRSEQALQRSHDELEQRIDERTIQLQKEVSEHKRAEEDLHANQRLLKTVFDTIPHAIFVKDTKFRHVMGNAALLKLVDLPEDEVLGYTAEEFPTIPMEEAKHYMEQDRQVLDTGESIILKATEITDGHGDKRVRDVAKIPLRDDDGRIVGLVGVTTDITEQKRAEEALKKSERLLQTVFDTMSIGVFVKDSERRYLLENRHEAFFNDRDESSIGKTNEELNLFSDEANWQARHEDLEVLNQGKYLDIPAKELRLSDGTLRVLRVIKAPLYNENGKVTGLVGIREDITERKMVEAQLRVAQKMEAVGQLAGGIAHDFNNLLQVIINYAHFARKNLDDAENLPGWLDNVIGAGDQAAVLTRQLLAFGRQTVLVQETVDLNDLTSDLVKMMGRVIEEDIELTFKPGNNLNLVLVDKGMIGQIILNLCVNARDAMPDGGRLIFETENHHADQQYCDNHGWRQPGDYAMISVSDNGAGISSEIREHIFEPFFTTKEVGKGTGLGLAMVHGIIQQHDGEIEVVSEPGAGTTFKIYFPKADSQEIKKEDTPARESPGGNETVLVAEDEEDVLSILSKSLESTGYQVLTARDGEEAMAVFKANVDRIDLVLLDMVMPKLRGWKVYEQIRESGSDVPVLFSSGYSLDPSDAAFAAKERVHTIQKPYGPNLLLTTVREVLDQQNS